MTQVTIDPDDLDANEEANEALQIEIDEADIPEDPDGGAEYRV